MGPLLVQHVDVGTFPHWDDYDVPALAELGVLSSAPGFGERMLDVTPAVEADLAAGRDASDFRIYFALATDGNHDDDFVLLFGSTLVVTYQTGP